MGLRGLGQGDAGLQQPVCPLVDVLRVADDKPNVMDVLDGPGFDSWGKLMKSQIIRT
jgi:hypothetical protein